MKLNNHGWGYKDMIIYSCILLILLFFAASSISELYDGIEASNAEKEKIRQQWAEKEAEEEKKEEMEEDIYVPSTPEEPEEPEDVEVDYNYYSLREKELKSATMSYLNDYNYDLSTAKMKITLDTLINFGYMVEMFDQTGLNVCTGYSNAYKDNYGNIIIDPYVKCDGFYVTNGY